MGSPGIELFAGYLQWTGIDTQEPENTSDFYVFLFAGYLQCSDRGELGSDIEHG